MDGNKLEKLREIRYEIKPACGSCVHSFFGDHDMFGLCGKHSYEHKKHTEKHRSLSVFKHGSCQDYQPGEIMNLVHGFKEFVK